MVIEEIGTGWKRATVYVVTSKSNAAKTASGEYATSAVYFGLTTNTDRREREHVRNTDGRRAALLQRYAPPINTLSFLGMPDLPCLSYWHGRLRERVG